MFSRNLKPIELLKPSQNENIGLILHKMVLSHIHLDPPLLHSDDLNKFVESQHGISTAVSTRGNSLAVFATAPGVGSRSHSPEES